MRIGPWRQQIGRQLASRSRRLWTRLRSHHRRGESSRRSHPGNLQGRRRGLRCQTRQIPLLKRQIHDGRYPPQNAKDHADVRGRLQRWTHVAYGKAEAMGELFRCGQADLPTFSTGQPFCKQMYFDLPFNRAWRKWRKCTR